MDFEELYKTHDKPWGSTPQPEIERFASELKPGFVLDVGVGDGRNALFLAERGFEVVGLDIAENAVNKLLSGAAERKVDDCVHGIVGDLAAYIPEKEYDNIISSFTLHFLNAEDFLGVVQRLQNATATGGLHIISDFTQDGSLYHPGTDKYWLKSGELQELYAGWNVIHYEERETTTRATDEAGNHYQQGMATIVGRKVRL
jgi:tellurite methyltransferase